jgi:hypothetical protein
MKTIEIYKKELIQISEENSKSIAYSVLLDISRKNLTDTEFFQLDNSTLYVYDNDAWEDKDFLVRKATGEELNMFNVLSFLKPYLKTF